jgi:hypothetical protein
MPEESLLGVNKIVTKISSAPVLPVPVFAPCKTIEKNSDY